jgi:hypothetical protein
MTTELSTKDYNGFWKCPVGLLTLRHSREVQSLYAAYHSTDWTLWFGLSRVRGRACACARPEKFEQKCPTNSLTRGESV